MHRNCVTAFQVWVVYHLSTLQLNLHHAARAFSPNCPLAAGCGENKEDSAHIFWTCGRARLAWTQLLEHCTKDKSTKTSQATRLSLLLPHIALQHAQPTAPAFISEIQETFGFYTKEHVAAMQLMWFVWASVIPTML